MLPAVLLHWGPVQDQAQRTGVKATAHAWPASLWAQQQQQTWGCARHFTNGYQSPSQLFEVR
jgi:hypothetical protein